MFLSVANNNEFKKNGSRFVIPNFFLCKVGTHSFVDLVFFIFLGAACIAVLTYSADRTSFAFIFRPALVKCNIFCSKK